MALIDILLQARDATAPAWASASSSVQRYGQTTTGAAVQVDRLTTRIGFQQRQLQILEEEIRQMTAAQGADALAVQRRQLAYDRLNDSLQRTIARQNQAGEGAAVLPRTFAGFTGRGALEALGGLGVATGIGEVAAQMRNLASQGQQTQAAIDSTTASLGVQLGSMERANQIWSEGQEFAERYKITQQDLAEALRASSQIIRTSTSDTEDLLSVLGRLQILSPEQGLQGAALALRELSSGDIVSLVDRFEISRQAANGMKQEIQGGADAVAVLGRYLDSAGITDRALETGLAGAAGETRAWARATEDLGLEINNLASSMGVFQGAADVIGNTADEIESIRGVFRDFGLQANAAGQSILNGPFGTVIRFLDRLEDRASGGVDWFVNRIFNPAPGGGQYGTNFGRAALAGVMAGQNIGTQQPTVVNNITVQGSIVTEQQATDMIHKGLLQKQAQSGDLGLSTRR